MISPGSPAVSAGDIQQRIETAIPGARVEAEGGEQHFSVAVVATAFEGMSRIDRHQKIYALFRDEMASQAIHALALKTMTPEEWERRNAQRLEIGS